ncbi:VOC family protein [Herbidospora sp. RD11066]
MANERTVPLLPCRSIDEIAEFYGALGFKQMYHQTRPNPYVSMKREDLQLDFFGMPDGFEPADSYGTCLVLVPDTGELFAAFAEGMRAAYGKILVSGIPRVTRPRKRKNTDDLTGFSIVDPGGNWIRIFAEPSGPSTPEAAPGKLAVALQNAVVQGDSRGDHAQAARILDTALRREQDTAPPADLVEALTYRAELALRLDDHDRARELIAQARELASSDAERAALDDLS